MAGCSCHQTCPKQSTASKHDNSYVSQKELNFLVSYKNGLASNIENKNAQFNESKTGAWNDKHAMKQKTIKRMSHMTSAHLYFIFNIHNPLYPQSLHGRT